MRILIFLILTFPLISEAQVISGTITSNGLPVIGANIFNNSNGEGTISNIDGEFSLNAREGQQIKITYVGYKDYLFEVEKADRYIISLEENNTALEEIVVTALGLERSTKDLGYAIQSLDQNAVSTVKASNFIDNLSGKLAGVIVTSGPTGVGSTSKITIRGESSFRNNNPLFVVDGIPINNNTTFNVTNEFAAGFQEVDFGNGAMDVNPDDIASITVLKGASAAALYGTRASNGVILINTKDGMDATGIGVEYNSSFFVERPFRLPDFQNSFGQGNSGKFEFKNGLGGGVNDNITYSYGPRLDAGILLPQYDSPVTLPNGDVVRGGDVAVHGGLPITPTPFVSNPDNLANFYETGISRINNLAFSGGLGKGSFRVSLTNFDNDSYIPGVNLNRNTISSKINYQLTDNLSLNGSFSYINTKSDNRPSNGYGSENINYSLVAWLGRQTNLDPLRDYWQPGLENLQQYSFNYTFFDNPYFILLENRNGLNRDRYFGNVSAKYSFNQHFSISLRTGMDNSGEDRTFRRAFSSNRFKNGAYAEHIVDFRETNTDVLLNYNKILDNWSVDAYLGANRMDQKSNNTQTQAIGLAQPGIFKLSNAASPLEIFQYDTDKRINSVYGIAKIGYKDFLYIDVSGRNDWSSALATSSSTANTSFFYPSVSSAILLSNIVELPSVFSFAKVRASWAQVGNDTDPYQTSGVFIPSTPYQGNPTFTEQSFIPNSNLLPEISTSIEFGADLRFLDDRIGFDITYFNTLNENQIISLPIPISTGYNQRVVNGGAVRASGLEVILNARPWVSKNFNWTSQVNFSQFNNTVESLPEEAKTITLSYNRVYDNPNQTVWFIVSEGSTIGDIWGTGYKRNQDGRFVVQDNGKLTVDNSLKKLGNYNPDFMVGWNNEMSYKKLSLRALIDWRQGGQLVSRTQALAGVAGQLKETEYRPDEGLVFDGVVNVGTEENPSYVENIIAISPETYYRDYYDRNHEENSLYDASYIKLRELALTYDFGKTLFKKIESLRFSLIGRNLFSIDKIPHFDPEQFAVQGTSIVSGVEDMSYPTARSFGASLNVTF